MFLGLPEKVAYTEPWFSNFEDRFAQLTTGSGKQRLKIAYFYETQDSSTFRYRVFNMVETLNSTPEKFSSSFFTLDDLPAMSRVVREANILILCRVRYTDAISNIIMQAKAAGCRVLYDVDDLIFDTDYAHLVVNTLGEKLTEKMWNRYFAYISRLGTVLKLCDQALVTNAMLAERVRDFAQVEAHVLPNFLNDAQLNLSASLYEKKKEKNFERDDKIHVGYFSGSPTHNRDFSIVAGVLARLLDKDERITLRLGGHLDSEELERFSARIEKFPMQDFLNLQLLQAKTEVNLVPLQSNFFTDCKSDLKYFEAGIVGTVTVASPVFAYRSSIEDGKNGFLAGDREWEEKIDAAIKKVDNGYKEMAEAAYIDSSNRYSKSMQLPAMTEVFQSLF